MTRNKTVPERMRRLMSARGWKRIELAAKLYVSPATITTVMNGTRELSRAAEAHLAIEEHKLSRATTRRK